MKSTLHELIEIIRTKSSIEKLRKIGEYDTLVNLLYQAIQEAISEVNNGADPRSFADKTILNLLLLSASKGYPSDEISEFVKQLQSDYHDYEECDDWNCRINHNYDEFDDKYNVKEEESIMWENTDEVIMKRDGIILRKATKEEVAAMKKITDASTPALNQNKPKTLSGEELTQAQDEYFENFKKMKNEQVLEDNDRSTHNTDKDAGEANVEPETKVSLPPINPYNTKQKHPQKTSEQISQTVNKISEIAQKSATKSAHVAKRVGNSASSILSIIIEKIMKEQEESQGVDIESIDTGEYSFGDVDYTDSSFDPESFNSKSAFDGDIEYKGTDFKRNSNGSGSNGTKRFI